MDQKPKFTKYVDQSVVEVLAELKTSALGLSQHEAERRLRRHGRNIIIQSKDFWREFLFEQLKSPVFLLVFGMGLVYSLIGNPLDSLIVGSFLLINLAIATTHEIRFRRSERKLREFLSGKIKVIRAGRRVVVDGRDLVLGDIVKLKIGDIVPADLRIIEERGLLVDESAINDRIGRSAKSVFPPAIGEADQSKATNILFMNTAVVGGSAEAVVVATGKETYFGRLSLSLKRKTGLSLYEKEVVDFSKSIFKIAGLTVAAIVLLKLIFSGAENFLEFSIFYVALLVSILPEALSLVTAFALSRGSVNLSKKNVVVKRLSAVEELGNIEILCTDKTGTLTENKLVLEKIFSGNPKKCFELAAAASSFVEHGALDTSFDEAIFNEINPKDRAELKNIHQIDSVPFDSDRMRADVLVSKAGGGKIMIMRGAPEVVINFCSQEIFTAAQPKKMTAKQKILKEFLSESRKGNRILAIAFKKIPPKCKQIERAEEKNLIFAGFISFIDPLKKTAEKTINMAESLGVEIKILTGDSPVAAAKIAKEIGILQSSRAGVIGRETLESLSESRFKKACFENSVFARLSPTLKTRIIETLKREKRVGFLGEGANDCLALEKSNVGLAVSEAADIARNAADVLLLRKDLRVIIEGIREGRKTFVNLNKYTKAALSANFGNFASISLLSFFFNHSPILPVQILLINLISDMTLIFLAADKAEKSDLKKPAVFDVPSSISLVLLMTSINFVFGMLTVWLFSFAGLPTVQSAWFTFSILSQVALIFVLRSRSFFDSEIPAKSLLTASAGSVFLALSLPYSAVGREFFNLVPLPTSSLVLVVLIAFIYFICSELAKKYFRRSLGV